MPTISIVLPTYNGSQYIRESIDSILVQSFSDWELIIVDDCSTDSTPDIIEEYVKKDNRIKMFHNETNLKLPASLNVGFEKAQGKYLTWTSDDNVYLSNAIDSMKRYLDENDEVPMVVANMDMIDASGDFIRKGPSYSKDRMICTNCVGACFMYRRQVLKDIGYYDTNMFLVEDYDYWLRILFYYGDIGYVNKNLMRYRVHETSLTTKRMDDIRKQIFVLRRKYLRHILDHFSECKDYLTCMYYEFKASGEKMEELDTIFYDAVPELKMDKGIDPERKIIVYGAGNYGNKAYEKFELQVEFFADSNNNIVGKLKNNREIISVDEMAKMVGKYQIMLAVRTEKIYELFGILKEKGISECCVYQNS